MARAGVGCRYDRYVVFKRAEQRGAAVGAVVLLHAVRGERVPPGGDAGRDGQPGGVPGRRVAAPAARAAAGRAARRRRAAARLHPGDGCHEPRAAAHRADHRIYLGGDIMGANLRHSILRAHVDLRLGASRGRAGHAHLRRRDPGRVHPRVGASVRAGQLHCRVCAAAGLPVHALAVMDEVV